MHLRLGRGRLRHLHDDLIELGERFSGAMLVAGNAAFALMWGVGGIAVPPTRVLDGPLGAPACRWRSA